jgi:hypothetical protein
MSDYNNQFDFTNVNKILFGVGNSESIVGDFKEGTIKTKIKVLQ